MFLEKWAEFLQPWEAHQSARIWSINNEEHSTGINIPIDKWLWFVCPSDLSTVTTWQSEKAFEKFPLGLYTTESGILNRTARGRKGCPVVEEGTQRTSLWVDLFKLGPHCVHGRWFRAQIPGGISMLSSRYQPPLKWWDATGMLIVWLGPKDSETKVTRISMFLLVAGAPEANIPGL